MPPDLAPPLQTRAARVTAMLALALAAALLAERLGMPLPWLLGPLLAVAAAGVLGAPVDCPAPLRHGGQWVIGTSLGLTFTPPVLAAVLTLAPAMAAGIGWALLAGALYGRVLARFAGHGDAAQRRATAHFAAAFGGASEMAVLGERHGGRVDLIAMAHSLRVLIVVVTIPFALQAAGFESRLPASVGAGAVRPGGLVLLAALTLGGAWLLRRAGGPNPFVLGSLAVALVLTGAGVELSALPATVSQGGQLLIGCALGARFTPDFVRSAPRWVAAVVAGAFALIALSGAFAWGVAQGAAQPWLTVLLGTSPGGIAEMCITAKVLQLGVPVVTAFHGTRYLEVRLATGPLFRWLEARTAPPG